MNKLKSYQPKWNAERSKYIRFRPHEKYNIENQVVNDIAQDIILCEKDNLIIQSNLNFSFECKDKKYNQYKEEFITTFDNIKN